MYRPILATLCLVSLLSTGCTTAINQKMASWMGHSYTELFMAWGPPSQVFDDGAGGRIVVYAQNRTWVTPGMSTTNTTGMATGTLYGNQMNLFGSANSYTTYYPSQVSQWTAYRMFRVNSAGIVTSWSWRGM